MIVDLLTEQYGRMSFIQHISKSRTARVKKQLFQPTMLLEIMFDQRPHARLQRLHEVRIATPYVSIPFEPAKLSISLFLAEFVYYSTREEQQNPSLFSYIETSLRWLDGASCHYASFHLVFMMRLSRFIGFFPNLEDYQPGSYFDLRGACFTVAPPLHPDYLAPDEASRIGTLMRMNYESMHLFRLSHTERNHITDLLLLYYRLHIPNFPDLRSLAVVRELFNESAAMPSTAG